MKFVRAIWKLLVGVKDALVLLLLILFFAGLYGALSARPAAVKDGVLDLNLNGSVVEQPARREWADVAGSSHIQTYRLRDLVAALDKARDDSRVKAVALDLDGFTGGGATAIGDVADAVRRVRASGKPVVAYGVGYTDDSYALASAASEIWLNPLGGVLIAGPGGSNLYYKGLLDKLGVTANVYRVGAYKSAVEPFIRNDMSPEARQNYTALDEARLETWKQEVKQARPKANVDLFLTNMNGAVAAAGGDLAKAALAAGLVDRIGDQRAFEARLADLGGGTGSDGIGFRQIKLGSYIADVVDQKPTGPIGVVTIAGMIVDGKAGPGSAGGDTIAKEIEDGVRNKGVKALVVRVDSPGGFGVLPSFQGTLQKLGVGADGVKTTPLSGEPDLFKGPSPQASQLIQTGVESMYGRFLAIVAASRHKTPQQVDQIAQGRVWDGGTAHQLGLVDGFGGMSDAIAKAAQLAGLGNERGIRYLEPQRSFRDQLLDTLTDQSDGTAAPADAFSMLARQPEQQLAGVLGEVRSILSGPSIQARCLECPPVAPARIQQRDLTLLGLIKQWLS